MSCRQRTGSLEMDTLAISRSKLLEQAYSLGRLPNDHELKIEQYFSQFRDERDGAQTQALPPLADDIRRYILCFTNRCGSNVLAAALASTGVLGHVTEAFNADCVINS